MSDSFENGKRIPLKFACFQLNGENKSPHLQWTHVQNAKSYAIFLEEYVPKKQKIYHWIIAHIPNTISSIPETIPFNSYILPYHGHVVIQGKNSWDQYGYNGMCSKLGVAKRYVFRVYALNKSFEDCTKCSPEEIIFKIREHIIDYGELWGWFLKEKPKLIENKYIITKNTPQDIPIFTTLQSEKDFKL